jgi:hypothetical protein
MSGVDGRKALVRRPVLERFDYEAQAVEIARLLTGLGSHWTVTERVVRVSAEHSALVSTVTIDRISREAAVGWRAGDARSASAEAFCGAAMKFRAVRARFSADEEWTPAARLARGYELEAFLGAARQCGLDPTCVSIERAGTTPEALTSAACLALVHEIKLRLACIHPKRRAENERAIRDGERARARSQTPPSGRKNSMIRVTIPVTFLAREGDGITKDNAVEAALETLRLAFDGWEDLHYVVDAAAARVEELPGQGPCTAEPSLRSPD